MTTVDESKLVSLIDRDEIVQLMRDLQAFQSFSGDEADAMRFLAGWLRERDIETELIDVSDEPGRPDLVGRIRGSGGGRSLNLNGHLDIDPVPLNYEGDPWACFERDGRLFGHGLGNMKSGVAALAAAAAAVSKAGIPLRGDLLITGVVGELQGGVGAYDLVQRGIGADYTIICEPSGTDVRTIHAGAIQMVINVTGSSAWIGALHHASPVNAVEKMMKVIEALHTVRFSAKQRDDLIGLPRLIVGGINGGIGHGYAKWRASYVPDYCSIIVEVRGLPGQDWEEARQDIERAIAPVAAQDPELRYEIGMPPATYSADWRSMKVPAYGIDVPPVHELPQTVRRRHVQVVGNEPARVGFQDPGSYAWTDAGHFARGGSVPIIYGPSSNQEHGAPIDNVINVARVLALSAAEICTRTV